MLLRPLLPLLSLLPLLLLVPRVACPSQSRIENAQTSGTLSKTIGMTRKIDTRAEREQRGAARAAKDGPQTSRGGEAEGTQSRYSTSSLVLVVHCQFYSFCFSILPTGSCGQGTPSFEISTTSVCRRELPAPTRTRHALLAINKKTSNKEDRLKFI